MPELIDVYQPGDRVLVMTAKGQVRVYEVRADGSLAEVDW